VKTPVADAPPVWRRSIAALIDLTAVLGITALLWWLGIARLAWPSGPYDWIDELGTLFGEHFERLIAPIYALLIVAFMWQAVGRLMGAGSTLGERISGLRALDAQGERPHPIRILIRSAAGVLTAWPIGWWLCFADPAGQTLADRITGYRLTHAR
jgi:uncharacterized RDD family membrane protein YckC